MQPAAPMEGPEPGPESEQGPEPEGMAPTPSGDQCLMGTGDFSGDGPYRVGMMDLEIGSQGGYTVFYPMPMQEGCHPVVAWGNGTGVTGSGTYAFFQQHAASWGIVVVASHNSNTGSGDFHVAALDWALEQNEDSGSMFHGKLNGRAGTSGHSQGGMGANAGARHRAVEAVGNVQGAFGFGPADKAFLCLTGTEDIATEGCRGAVNGSRAPALYANWDGGDHVGTPTVGGFIARDPGTMQYRRLYTGWFRCFLGDDSNACSMFMGGDSCPVCNESGWASIFAKNY